jgi:GR25 family glycosyltransferase involved in LPS biosynthesis
MKHYWINIDTCHQRRAYMEEQFTEHAIDHVRVSAETPGTMKTYTIHRHPDSKETNAEIACVLSHLKAIKQGYNDGDEFFCVTEDDISIRKINFEKVLGYVNKAVLKHGKPAEIIQLHTSGTPFIVKFAEKYVLKQYSNPEFIVPRDGDYPGTICYIISRTGAKKILDKLVISDTEYDLTFSCWTAADNILYTSLESYIITYPIVTTNIDYGSIIHPSHLQSHDHANKVIKQIHQMYNMLEYFS